MFLQEPNYSFAVGEIAICNVFPISSCPAQVVSCDLERSPMWPQYCRVCSVVQEALDSDKIKIIKIDRFCREHGMEWGAEPGARLIDVQS